MIRTKQDWLVRNGKKSGALGGIRTPDTWFRRPVLYPLSYERLLSMLSGRREERKVASALRRVSALSCIVVYGMYLKELKWFATRPEVTHLQDLDPGL